MWIYLVGAILSLVIVMIIGVISSKKVKNSDDYFVAGRNLSLPVIVGTLTAGFLGTGTVVGYGALTFNTGLGAFWWIIGGLLGLFFIVLIAKKLNKLAIYTLPDILEVRYGASTKLLTTIPIVIAYTSIVGSQMKAIGYILELLIGINPTTGLIIAGITVIAYTVMGGMISVAYT